MANVGFQRVEALEVGRLTTPRASHINKEGDLIFKSSSRKILDKLYIGVKVLSKDDDLRVGFIETYYSVAIFAFLLGFGFFLGFMSFTMYGPINSGESPLSSLVPLVVGLIAVAIVIAPLVFFCGIPFLIWRYRLKTILIETAESLDSKQITPFEKTFVTLEKWRPSRFEQFVKAFVIIAIVFIIIALILSML